jgi:hypothetical protein
MTDELKTRDEVKDALVQCESRLKVLKGKATSEQSGDLDEIEDDLKTCRLELNEAEHRTDDEWEEAKHGIVRRLSQARRALDSTGRTFR